MFISSQDVLYIVISFCALTVTVFLSILFFYMIKFFKNISKIVEEFRVRLQGLMDVATHIRNKVEQMSSILSLVTDGAVGFVKKAVVKKAHDWIDDGAENVSESAKEAVDRAMEATAKKIKRASRNI
jgi:F0F1-type ATP synthase membrane subunit b/b'